MRPYVFVNLAMSADGKISTRERRQVKISGSGDFERVDRIKARSDAIMIGIGTVLADNPSLTVKSPVHKEERKKAGKEENPVRIVVDSEARIPPDADILRKGTGMRIIAVSERAPKDRMAILGRHAKIIMAGTDAVDLPVFLEKLGEMGIQRLMVEGGGTLIWGLFQAGCVDEICTYVGDMIIGGKDAPTPAEGEGYIHEEDFPLLELISVVPLDGGVLIRWKVARS